MWIFSYSCIAVALCVFSLNEHFGFANWVPMVILIVYQLSYGLGAGPRYLPWYLGPRYLPDSVRPQGSILSGCIMYGFAAVLTFVFPIMRESMGLFGLFLFYYCSSFVSAIIGGIVIYEPKSREEVNMEDQASEEDDFETIPEL